MTERWLEVYAKDDVERYSVYELADEVGCASIHHFAEPWFPDGWCIRVLPSDDEAYLAFVSRIEMEFIIWNSLPDEERFGSDWPQVRAFFEAASRLALLSKPGDWSHRKAIHCALNSWGYDIDDEFKFGVRFTWGRIRIWLHCLAWSHRSGDCRYGCHSRKWAA